MQWQTRSMSRTDTRNLTEQEGEGRGEQGNEGDGNMSLEEKLMGVFAKLQWSMKRDSEDRKQEITNLKPNLGEKVDQTNTKIEQTNASVEQNLKQCLTYKIEEANMGIEQKISHKIEQTNVKIGDLGNRVDETNEAMARISSELKQRHKS